MSAPEEICYSSRKYKCYWLYFSKIPCTVFIIVVGVLFICLFYTLNSKISLPPWKNWFFILAMLAIAVSALWLSLVPGLTVKPEKPMIFFLISTFIITVPGDELNLQQCDGVKITQAYLVTYFFHILCLEMKASSYFHSAAVLVLCTARSIESLIQGLWSQWKSFSGFWTRQEGSTSLSLLETHCISVAWGHFIWRCNILGR